MLLVRNKSKGFLNRIVTSMIYYEKSACLKNTAKPILVQKKLILKNQIGVAYYESIIGALY